MDELDDLGRGRTLAGNALHRYAPALGNDGAMLRILDVARSRQLIAALAVLAPALPVSLPGDGCISATGLADFAGSQHEVDARQHVVNAGAVMLDAARVQ